MNRPCDNIGRTPLAVAASEGHAGIMELLLSRHADLEAKDTVVNEATKSGSAAEAAAAVATKTTGMTPVAWAVLRGKRAAVDLLARSGCKLDVVDSHGRTLFHHAAISGDVKTFDSLVAGFPDQRNMAALIEAADKDGIRPIDRAVGHAHEAVVSRLLKKGAKLGPTTWTMARGKPKIT